MLRKIFSATGLVASLMLAGVGSTHAAEPVQQLRLYAIDCGRIDIKDMGMFADTGEYDGKSGKVVTPCFLIRHPKGTLLWDTGLGDKLAGNKDGVDNGGFLLHVDTSLQSQLQGIGVAPGDVGYVAFSHMHFDHMGNANAFPAATWILNSAELAWAQSTPPPFGVDPSAFAGYKSAKTQMIDSDLDLFGDGSVRILKTPGHTPGHQVLVLKLKKAGTVVLSGDLYHTRENRKFHRVPSFNVERADTLASIDRVEAIVKNSKGKLFVQHDPLDFKLLPKFPAYLD
ncbi:N-acyl homoserine lactonase family protein [Uliginosibacterium sp. H3]|uniref:N-acyl homoserine lactonase family protein n=1 Tax=Uliginosibacterium silvisoli TaxID=3114758 RepID=A0ABU6JYP1_9RHOO|nr:N-acyl homoserine lactonase family protein [Uliginosibacterium sp. H3]